jgi:hypothetical protein
MHGECLSREELEALFAQWPEGLVSGVNHDISALPVCRVFNKRLEIEPDDELSLKVDVEVLDEDRFSSFGGFSIAFSRLRVRVGQGDAVAVISVNPRHFNIDEVIAAIASTNGEVGTIDVVERVEKASLIETAVVAIAVFVGLQTFSGFFNAAGAALFELLRRQRRADDPSAPIRIQFHLHLHPDRRVPVVVLTAAADCIAADVQSVDGPALLSLVEARFGHTPVQKVAGRLLPGGIIEIDHVTALDGRLLYEADPDA